MGDKVVRLVDRVPAPVDGNTGMADWLHSWADSFASGEYGDIGALVVVVESKDGRLAKISQSIHTLDKTRLVGLLAMAAHRCIDNATDIEHLKEP